MEQFERNTIDFLLRKYASYSLFGKKVGIGNVDDDDTHVLNVVEFQAMIDNL